MDNEQWQPGRILERARVSSGISKRAAASAAGMSESWYRKIESGWTTIGGERVPVDPSAEMLSRAARAVGATVSDVLTAANLWDDNDPTQDVADSPRAELALLASRLEESDVPIAIGFLQGLLARRR